MDTAHYHNIIAFLRDVSADTEFAGHVYTVGGCCRDALMGQPINDVDVAVTLPNGGIRFAEYMHKRGLLAGAPVYFEKYGTAMLRLRDFPDDEIEIVQTRRGQYADNADAAAVFGSLEDDARRRDLTVNTLYTDVRDGRLIDVTGRAVADINAHRLFTPMEPEQTFDDDPVRMLRIIRFAARWGWLVDEAVLQVIMRDFDALKRVKIERKRAELEKMIAGPDPRRALMMAEQCNVLAPLLPRFARVRYNRVPSCDGRRKILRRAADALDYLAKNNVPGDCLAVRWAVLLHGLDTHKDGRNYLSPDAKAVQRNVVLAESDLRFVHHHSKFINPVLHILRQMRVCRKWSPTLDNVRDRQVEAFRRACITPEKFENVLAAIDAVNQASGVEKAYAQQVNIIRQRLAEIDKRHDNKFKKNGRNTKY